MGRDDLLKMLGLGDAASAATGPDPIAPPDTPSTKQGAPPANPNAMITDEWT
jgi:hypothetical protein